MTNFSNNAKAAGLAVAAFTVAAADQAMARDLSTTIESSLIIGGCALTGGILGVVSLFLLDIPARLIFPVVFGGAVYGLIGGTVLSDKVLDTHYLDHKGPAHNISVLAPR